MELIGVITGRTSDLKQEYQIDDICFAVEIRLDKRKKALKIDLMDFHTCMEKLWSGPRKRISKKVAKELEKDEHKPVDTSNWVKPDEHSIRRELLSQLVEQHIFPEDSKQWLYAGAKIEVLFSILHSTSPSNPQCLMNYYIHSNVETIYSEIGNKAKAGHLWKRIMKKNYDHDKAIKYRKDWIAKQWKEMINLPL